MKPASNILVKLVIISTITIKKQFLFILKINCYGVLQVLIFFHPLCTYSFILCLLMRILFLILLTSC